MGIRKQVEKEKRRKINHKRHKSKRERMKNEN
jgi:hypothetical protein